MDVNGFGPTASAPAAQGSGSPLSTLTDKFDNFLLLLTKQLQHQDPLSPLDTNEFTSQLVQFTGVEQAINTNSKLDQLIGLQSAGQAVDAFAFLNTTVDADSDQFRLEDGTAEIRYELPENAAETAIVILDASGKPVRIADGALTAGQHSFAWDGRDNDGGALPDGVYSVQIAPVDGNGDAITAKTWRRGQVDAVSIQDGALILTIDGIDTPASSVRSVQPSSAA